MTLTAIHLRTLQKAATILGGHDALAAHLQVSPQEVAGWMSGEKLPSRVFNALVDLVAASWVQGNSSQGAKSAP